ncbi:MAG TPA: type VI secretion system accessory protein TagJ [Gemmatimonadales bacterium]|nr:type VI secretion system accessory protein TagJ [Gemmatimonadales bacterium]
MKARALLDEGRLGEAIESLGVELRSNPGDAQRRAFLFELLCFAGEYDRAEKHLDILAGAGEKAAMGALVYRSALHAERTRRTMFQEGSYPRHHQALPPVSGTINGRPFKSLTDADPRIGPRLEIFAAGQYSWLPLASVASVRCQAPQKLRDLLWIPAKLLTAEGYQGLDLGEVMLPALAPRTDESDDPAVRLGRATEWVRWEDGTEAPLGQKLLLVDGEEMPILELRELVITPVPTAA